ncbi:MAG: hypothetical protein ABR908_13060 [Terriglobales bacterium]|jgi:hypothetical protein
MRRHWKVALPTIAFLTLTACDKTQPVQTKQEAPVIEDASQPRLATLPQQKLCAEQADKQFNIYGTPRSGDTANDFVSHYDARANVCYMMIHRAGMTYGKVSVEDIVFDAFENHDYATYWRSSSDAAPSRCEVKPRGRPEIKCKSSEEFDSLVERYFGLAR